MQTLGENESWYQTIALIILCVVPIIMSCWRFYNIKRTFFKFFGLIIACVLYLFLVLGYRVGVYLCKLFTWFSKIPERGFVEIGSSITVGITRALNYLIVLLRKTFTLFDDIYEALFPLKEAAISEGITNEEVLTKLDEDGEGPRKIDFGFAGEGGEGESLSREQYLTDWIKKDAIYIFNCFKIEVLASIALNLIAFGVYGLYFEGIPSLNNDTSINISQLINNSNKSNSKISNVISNIDLSSNYIFIDNFFRMKLYFYVYDVLKIKKTFGDMYKVIENLVTNILSSKHQIIGI